MEQKSPENKSLLIIKSNPQSLGPVESFLRNRQWTVKSTANLKEALVYLVQHQPTFVMVSIDHPNRKVRNLPKVLTQAFPVCVIPFAETASAANMKMLADMSSGYSLFPPVTGPAIERTFNKYQKDLQNKGPSLQSIDSQWNEGNEKLKQALIAIKGGNASGNESDPSLIAQLLVGESDLTAVASTTRSTDGAFMKSDSPKGELHHAQTSSGLSKLHVHHPSPTDRKTNSADISSDAKKNMASEWKPLEPSNKEPDQTSTNSSEAEKIFKRQDSLIVKGARDALEKACLKSEGLHNTLHTATHLACIVISSSRFSGYLVTAMAKDRMVEKPFIETIRKRLIKFLRANGEHAEENESLSIKVREVPFEKWALSDADFLRKSVHNGEEVAMAFFPRVDIKASFKETEDSEMAAVSINELIPNSPVEFNIYIHLPRNNKYVLYTPCGGTFFANQRDRLKQQGISHLHILKLELSGLDKYRAQHFLNEKIHNFHTQQPENEAS